MTMINNKSEIINKLFFDELKELIDKYIKEYILKDSNRLDEIITEYKNTNNLDIDKVIFFAWYNLNIEEISMKNISNYYNELISQNYTENDNYLIYTNKNDLREYAKNELDYMLDMEIHIDRLFDKDAIIDFWLNNTTKEELLEEIMLNDDVEEILDLSPDYAFTLSNGIEYVFSNK